MLVRFRSVLIESGFHRRHRATFRVDCARERCRALADFPNSVSPDLDRRLGTLKQRQQGFELGPRRCDIPASPRYARIGHPDCSSLQMRA